MPDTLKVATSAELHAGGKTSSSLTLSSLSSPDFTAAMNVFKMYSFAVTFSIVTFERDGYASNRLNNAILLFFSSSSSTPPTT